MEQQAQKGEVPQAIEGTQIQKIGCCVSVHRQEDFLSMFQPF